MKKIFIIMLIFLSLCSCYQKEKDKKVINSENNNFITKETIFSENKKFISKFVSSSEACALWQIFLEENWNSKVIFKWKKDFIYCSPEINKIDGKNAEIFICYTSWWWSWECEAVLFKYNLEKNSWKFLDSWTYWYSSEKLKKFEKKSDDKDLEEFLEFMEKNYIIEK